MVIEPTTADAAALVATGGVELFGSGAPFAFAGTGIDGLADADGVADPTVVARTTMTIPITDASDFRLVDRLACSVMNSAFLICATNA